MRERGFVRVDCRFGQDEEALIVSGPSTRRLLRATVICVGQRSVSVGEAEANSSRGGCAALCTDEVGPTRRLGGYRLSVGAFDHSAPSCSRSPQGSVGNRLAPCFVSVRGANSWRRAIAGQLMHEYDVERGRQVGEHSPTMQSRLLSWAQRVNIGQARWRVTVT